MADLDAIERALRNADAAGDTEAATQLARAYRDGKAAADSNYSNEGHNRPQVNPDAQGGTVGRFAAAVSGATDTMRVGLHDAARRLFPDQDPNRKGLLTGAPVPGTSQEAQQARADSEVLMQRSRNASEAYEATKDQLGTAGAVGDVVPELALTAAPIARAGGAVARAPMLVKALGRYAPAVGDIVANASYSGAKSAAQGKSASEVVDDTLQGGAGAAAGRVLVRALGGVKPLVSSSARALVDKGVIPSPGQLFDGPVGNILRSTEDRLSGFPGVGDVIQYARRRSVADYGRAETNDAIQPLVAKGARAIDATGAEAADAAESRISDAFTKGLKDMEVKPAKLTATLDDIHQDLPGHQLIDDAQVAKLDKFLADRFGVIERKGQSIDGETAKKIDEELGFYARKYSRSINPTDHPMGDAFYGIQTRWRALMADSAAPGNYELVKAANAAHRNMLPIYKAVDKAKAQGGVFTPNQLQRSYGPYRQRQTPLNQAAQEVLPSKVPDSGTAGRYLLGAALAGGAAISGGAATATALAAALYSRTGSRLLLGGIPGLAKGSVDYLSKLAPDKLVQELARMHQKYPYLRDSIDNAVRNVAKVTREGAAQYGRMQAQEPDQQPSSFEEPTQ